MNNYAFATIQTLKKALENKEISMQELVTLYQDRAQKLQSLNAIIESFSTDSVLKNYEPKGMLAGIPGYIKDNICQKDRITSCGSNILKNFRSTYDATAISRLRSQGALFLGRANCDEFAMGSSGETSAYGVTYNPWNQACVPGGSSSGSAVAVAAGLAPWSLGSETGGSVRQPAALCGIVGFKPTYGLVSRYGLVAYGSSLDQIGIFSRTVYDTALVLSAIAGNDDHDSSSLAVEAQDYTKALTEKLPQGLTIGVVDNAMNAEGLHPEIRQANLDALQVLEAAGATIKYISIPALEYCAASYFIISRAEAASNLSRFDGVRYGSRVSEKTLKDMYNATRSSGFGTEVKARIMMGNYVLSVGHAKDFYENAQKVRRLIQKQMEDACKQVDLFVMPTHAIPAFKVGAFNDNKLEMDLQDYYTAPINLAGVPAISLPVGFTKDNKPIGMQLIGPRLSEQLIFNVGHAYQQITDWHTKTPSC